MQQIGLNPTAASGFNRPSEMNDHHMLPGFSLQVLIHSWFLWRSSLAIPPIVNVLHLTFQLIHIIRT
ncbi:MAG: hypothetical protein JWQ98_1053 [Chlorobi bacterium]|nr:hypothetical protein [Chlorobiota bacterium]